MKFHLKIRDEATRKDRSKVEKAARDFGASAVRPLFPDAAEPSLNTLYAIDVSEPIAEQLVSLLRALPIVEFVEREAKRTLKDR